MYNRYIPEDVSYTPVGPPSPEPPRVPRAGSGSRPPLRFPDFLSGGENLMGGGAGSTLSALLKSCHLDGVDTGDILLLLIMLYLLVEGDDLELVIALGLTLLMGLGEDKEGEKPPC